ncbi:MAG: hypothetical protein ACD_21C00186G0005, partial [uncultured bacterium]
MKPTNKNLFTLLVVLCAFFLWIGFNWWSFLNRPLIEAGQKPGSFLFIQGMSVKKAAMALKQQNLIKHTLFFSLLTRIKGVERNLKAGEYSIEPGITTPSTLLAKMVRGEAINHAFTIVEGWTFSQVITALNNNPYIKHTIQNLSTDEIMAKIGHPGELPEGRFAPDTYLFSGEIKDTDILINAYQLLQKRLQMAWANKSSNVPYHCPYEALTSASIIEKETAVEQEKPIIAGVIMRRLAQSMLLQSCPTVIYGMGQKYNGKLNKADYLKDTPYNTYTRKG